MIKVVRVQNQTSYFYCGFKTKAICDQYIDHAKSMGFEAEIIKTRNDNLKAIGIWTVLFNQHLRLLVYKEEIKGVRVWHKVLTLDNKFEMHSFYK